MLERVDVIPDLIQRRQVYDNYEKCLNWVIENIEDPHKNHSFIMSLHIQTLQKVSLPRIVDCLVDAFTGYFVPMPSEVSFWEKRYKAARVDWALSQGVFDKEKLVAFITNGIDIHKGEFIAFNSGTGVIESHRGRQLVDKMYAFSLPQLQNKGVKKCMLEVIQANNRAIRVYERIGFSIKRSLKCYKGKLSYPARQVALQKVASSDILKLPQPNHDFYSWDNTNAAIQLFDDYSYYVVNTHGGEYLGHFIIRA